MLLREMGRQECENLLTKLGYGRLACAHNNQPYIAPIYFAFEPGQIFGFATMGQKIKWMRLNPQVCIEADEVESETDWSSVIVKGRFEEFPDRPEYSEQRKKAQAVLEKMRPLWWQPAFAANQTRSELDRDTIFYCVHIEEMSGRRASRNPLPFE